jgi:hypothetical protein
MLIITHCEEKSEEERNHFIDEFFQHPDVIKHGLREFFGLGVYFTGCLRAQLQSNPNNEAASQQARNVFQMRQKLLDFLIARDETFNIHYTPNASSVNTNFGLIVPSVLVVLAGIFCIGFRWNFSVLVILAGIFLFWLLYRKRFPRF